MSLPSGLTFAGRLRPRGERRGRAADGFQRAAGSLVYLEVGVRNRDGIDAIAQAKLASAW